jgi:hypothetical protein
MIHVLRYRCIHPCNHSSNHSFIHSFIQLSIYSSIQHPSICLFTYSSIQPSIHPLIYSFMHSPINAFLHLFPHSFIHASTHYSSLHYTVPVPWHSQKHYSQATLPQLLFVQLMLQYVGQCFLSKDKMGVISLDIYSNLYNFMGR